MSNIERIRHLGVIMIIATGVIFAIERGGSLIAKSKEIAAMYEIHMFDSSSSIRVVGFWDNAFVPILAFIGVLLFGLSFIEIWTQSRLWKREKGRITKKP